MKEKILVGAAALSVVSLLSWWIPNSEVHWATKDTVFIWAEHCEIIKTCDGYKEMLKDYMEDGVIQRWEYWVLESKFESGKDAYRIANL